MAHILLIDDDHALREILVLALTRTGHKVSQAANGAQGLILFREKPADLVITDIVMPEQEGIETILALRSESPKTPVIAISGGAVCSETYLVLARQLGVSSTLAKPFTQEQLRQAIDNALGETPASPSAA